MPNGNPSNRTPPPTHAAIIDPFCEKSVATGSWNIFPSGPTYWGSETGVGRFLPDNTMLNSFAFTVPHGNIENEAGKVAVLQYGADEGLR